ncbi:MAG: hypothetical protein QW767_05965 [Thermoprotei archaeon]
MSRPVEGSDSQRGAAQGSWLRVLFTVTTKRAALFGRLYLAIGVVFPVVLGVVLVSRAAAGRVVAAEIFPLIIPVFAVMASMGGLMVYVSDRSHGVYEYLLSYGVNIYDIFGSVLASSLVLVSVSLAATSAATLGFLSLEHITLPQQTVKLLLVYSIPVGYAASAFMTVAGVLWSSLTVRVTGVNSPVGIAPLLGVGPILLVLLASEASGSLGSLTVAGVGTAGIVVATVGLIVYAGRRMSAERLLSEA